MPAFADRKAMEVLLKETREEYESTLEMQLDLTGMHITCFSIHYQEWGRLYFHTSSSHCQVNFLSCVSTCEACVTIAGHGALCERFQQ